MKWLFKYMSLYESLIQVKIKLRHQAKENYFSPSCVRLTAQHWLWCIRGHELGL